MLPHVRAGASAGFLELIVGHGGWRWIFHSNIFTSLVLGVGNDWLPPVDRVRFYGVRDGGARRTPGSRMGHQGCLRDIQAFGLLTQGNCFRDAVLAT